MRTLTAIAALALALAGFGQASAAAAVFPRTAETAPAYHYSLEFDGTTTETVYGAPLQVRLIGEWITSLSYAPNPVLSSPTTGDVPIVITHDTTQVLGGERMAFDTNLYRADGQPWPVGEFDFTVALDGFDYETGAPIRMTTSSSMHAVVAPSGLKLTLDWQDLGADDETVLLRPGVWGDASQPLTGEISVVITAPDGSTVFERHDAESIWPTFAWRPPQPNVDYTATVSFTTSDESASLFENPEPQPWTITSPEWAVPVVPVAAPSVAPEPEPEPASESTEEDVAPVVAVEQTGASEESGTWSLAAILTGAAGGAILVLAIGFAIRGITGRRGRRSESDPAGGGEPAPTADAAAEDALAEDSAEAPVAESSVAESGTDAPVAASEPDAETGNVPLGEPSRA
ncbi:hypothetical protein [Agromyces seonyuensis]|uniref:Uncharacterized protein n=1 Tax=Agromyces seonyuensis TaxID=2662446 RepID=A0A6I4P6C3_9MICO|nr:hypothetical protein [Agromyces seonyuensis]MWB99137.1 hypothetical protein [Agromyces seonyuensis]